MRCFCIVCCIVLCLSMSLSLPSRKRKFLLGLKSQKKFRRWQKAIKNSLYFCQADCSKLDIVGLNLLFLCWLRSKSSLLLLSRCHFISSQFFHCMDCDNHNVQSQNSWDCDNHDVQSQNSWICDNHDVQSQNGIFGSVVGHYLFCCDLRFCNNISHKR